MADSSAHVPHKKENVLKRMKKKFKFNACCGEKQETPRASRVRNTEAPARIQERQFGREVATSAAGQVIGNLLGDAMGIAGPAAEEVLKVALPIMPANADSAPVLNVYQNDDVVASESKEELGENMDIED